MGKRGPAPKPTALRLVEGNPGNRPINHREPKPTLGAPPMPEWMRPDAKRVWRHTVPMLKQMGVLAHVDRDALAMYCQMYARWREAEEFLKEKGAVYVVRTDGGAVKYAAQYPQVGIASNLAKQVRAYQQEFGMTPSARSQIEVPDLGNDEDKFEEFLSRKHGTKKE